MRADLTTMCKSTVKLDTVFEVKSHGPIFIATTCSKVMFVIVFVCLCVRLPNHAASL